MLLAMTELIQTALYAHYLKGRDVETPLCTIKCESFMIHFCRKRACAESAYYNEIDEQFVKDHWIDLRHVIHSGLCICCCPKYILDDLYHQSSVRSATGYRVEGMPLAVREFIDVYGVNELVYVPKKDSAVACALDTDLHELSFADHVLDYVRMSDDGKFRKSTEGDTDAICLWHPRSVILPSAMALLSMPDEDSVSEQSKINPVETVSVNHTVIEEEAAVDNTPKLKEVVSTGKYNMLRAALEALDSDLPEKLELILVNSTDES